MAQSWIDTNGCFRKFICPFQRFHTNLGDHDGAYRRRVYRSIVEALRKGGRAGINCLRNGRSNVPIAFGKRQEHLSRDSIKDSVLSFGPFGLPPKATLLEK
jgi:hypothetical protein